MKNLRLVLFIMVFCAALTTGAQNRSINFQELTWQQALNKARQSQKLIFMDAYASWCRPCKWMSANIFTNDTVADIFNEQFICVKFDMEKGEGIQLREQFNIKAYPTLLFVDSKGKMVHRSVGAMQQVREYIELCKTATDPLNRLAGFEERLPGNKDNAVFLRSYLEVLQKAYLPYDQILEQYFATQKQEDLFASQNWKIIYRFVNNTIWPQFNFLFENRSKYAELYSQDSVDTKISSVFYNSINAILNAKTFDPLKYEAAKRQILETGYEHADKIVFQADLDRARRANDPGAYAQTALEGVPQHLWLDPTALNEVAWFVFENYSEEEMLQQALKWAARSVELDTKPYNLDTYACILHKLGFIDEAIIHEEKAIQLAEEMGEPTENYRQMLERFRKEK